MHYLYENKIHYHADLLKLLKLELQTLPKGRMKCIQGKFYYQVVDGKTVGITKNRILVSQYCRKALVLFLVKHLEKQRTLPAHLHQKLSIKEIIAAISTPYQGFPLHYYFHSQHKDWLQMKSPTSEFHPVDLKYPTSKNFLVRSKSEVITVDHLNKLEIPFLYESSFQGLGKKIYPDFLLFCPFTGKLIPWEHFGALHKDGYERKMRDKILLFNRLGFKLFETVIYTFESDIEDAGRIEEIIKEIILNPSF